MKLTTALKLLSKKFLSNKEKEYASFVLAEKVSSVLYPKVRFSEYGRIWLEDKDFFGFYEKFHGTGNYHSADRKYFLLNLLKLADGLEGDLAECGVYQGASAWLICNNFRNSGGEF